MAKSIADMQVDLGQLNDQINTLDEKLNNLFSRHAQAQQRYGQGHEKEIKAREALERGERQQQSLGYKEQKIQSDITKELQKQSQFAGGMFSSANKFHQGLTKSVKDMNQVFSVWKSALGTLGIGSSLFAVDKLIQSAADTTKAARGLASTYGGYKSAGVAFGYAGNPAETMSKIAAGASPTSEYYAPMAIMGLNTPEERKKDTSEQLADSYRKLFSEIQAGKSKGQDRGTFMATHPWLGQMFDQTTLNNYWMLSKKQFALNEERYKQDQKSMTLTEDQQNTLTSLSQTFDETAGIIETNFQKAIINLAPELIKFSTEMIELSTHTEEYVRDVMAIATATENWLNSITKWEDDIGKSLWGNKDIAPGEADANTGITTGKEGTGPTGGNWWDPRTWGGQKGGANLPSQFATPKEFEIPGGGGFSIPGGAPYSAAAPGGESTGEGGVPTAIPDTPYFSGTGGVPGFGGGGGGGGVGGGGGFVPKAWQEPTDTSTGKTSGRYPGRIVPGSGGPTGERQLPLETIQRSREARTGAGGDARISGAMSILQKEGLSKKEAASLTGQMWAESNIMPLKPHWDVSHFSRGVAQWSSGGGKANENRYQPLADWAKAQGLDPDTYQGQVAMAGHEWMRDYHNKYSKDIEAAGSVADITRGSDVFERYAGWKTGARPKAIAGAGRALQLDTGQIGAQNAIDKATAPRKAAPGGAAYPPTNKPAAPGPMSMIDTNTFQGVNKQYSIRINNQAGANYAVQGGMLGAGAGNFGVA